MNSCSEIRESIGPWLDGELPNPQADAVRAHLEACLECCEERRQLEKLNSVMKGAFELADYQLDALVFSRGLRRITAK